MKSSAQLNLDPFSPERRASERRGSSDAALAQQRQQQEITRLQAEHAGALDIERLIARLPGGQAESGQTLRRLLRQHGRYVRLTRPLGPAALSWSAQTGTGRAGEAQSSRHRWPSSPVLNPKVVGWLERLSGLRPPPDSSVPSLTLEEGRAALVLPSSVGAVLLAEEGGQVFQFLPASGPVEGRWQLVAAVEEVHTGHDALVHEGALGLERQPEAWTQLSSARGRERARRMRLITLLLGAALLVLLARLLMHGGLWLLTGPALVALVLVCVSFERRFSGWVKHGTALRGLPTTSAKFAPAPLPTRAFSAQHERLLSAPARSRLESLRAALARARAVGGQPLTAAVSADLDGLLEDRFSYLAADPALDTLLEGQLEALQVRLDDRLDLERQRARELAAERLRRETIDSHF